MRRPALTIVLVGVVIVSAFSVGYVFGRQSKQPSEVPPPQSPGSAIVPSVVGLTTEGAIRLLEETGLSVQIVTRRTRMVPPETIFRQDPLPGTQVALGTLVTVVQARAG